MGIIVEHSSAYNPASNGISESGVKRLKNIIIKSHLKTQTDIDQAAYSYNSKSRTNGQGRPLDLFLKRKTKFMLPTVNKTQLAVKDLRAKRQRQFELMRLRSQKHKKLPTFDVGDHVRIRDQKSGLWNEKGVVLDVRKHKGKDSWSYWLDSNGTTFLRNGKDLRALYSNIEHIHLAGPPCPTYSVHA